MSIGGLPFKSRCDRFPNSVTKLDTLEASVGQDLEKGKVGRPARTSRQEILEEATELLRHEGFRAFSMRRLARRLGTAPTAIYTFYEGKDELLQALAESALAELWVDCDEVSDWEQGLRTWMLDFRAKLLEARWLEDLIALSCSSPALLSGVARLAQLLERAGLSRRYAALMAQNLLWTVLGFVLLELGAEQPDIALGIKQAQRQVGHEQLTEHLALDNYDSLYEISIESAIAGVAKRADQGI